MLNNSGESGHPCLGPDLRENAFRFSPLRIMIDACLSFMGFVILSEIGSFYAFFLESFFLNHNWVLNFVKSFLCLY